MRNTLLLLLPRGRAWHTTLDKPLRKYMDALGDAFSDIRDHLGRAYTDLLPEQTRRLEEWEEQFGLTAGTLTDQERRRRIEAAWLTSDGQGLDVLQDALQSRGFEVFLHNWWVPGTEPAPGVTGNPTIRDPAVLLANTQARRARVDAGEALAMAGEPLALAGNSLVSGTPPLGYILANVIQSDSGRVEYNIPTDPAEFPHVIYVGGQTFGDYVNIPRSRQAELETLCRKILPGHKWVGMLINYI